MTTLLRRLWNDDQGAIISVEWILVVGVLIFGLIPGLVALRNTINAEMATIGNILMAITPNFTYSGFGIGAANGGANNIAQVGGFQTSSLSPTFVSSYALTPSLVSNAVYVDPTP